MMGIWRTALLTPLTGEMGNHCRPRLLKCSAAALPPRTKIENDLWVATLTQPYPQSGSRVPARRKEESWHKGKTFQVGDSRQTHFAFLGPPLPPLPLSLRTKINYAHSFLIGDGRCHCRCQPETESRDPIRRPSPPRAAQIGEIRYLPSQTNFRVQRGVQSQSQSRSAVGVIDRQRASAGGAGGRGRGLTAWLPLRSINLSLVFTPERTNSNKRTRESSSSMETVDYASFVSFAVSLSLPLSLPLFLSLSLGGGDQNDEASTPCSIGSLGMEREREREGEFDSLARVDVDDEGVATHFYL